MANDLGHLSKDSTEWCLATDVKLLAWLKGFSNQVTQRAQAINARMDALSHDTLGAQADLQNAFTGLRQLSDTQFIEQRVQDDDDMSAPSSPSAAADDARPSTAPDPESFEQSVVPKYREAVHRAWQVLAPQTSVPSSTEAESKWEPASRRSKWLDRPLPLILGTDALLADEYCGLPPPETRENFYPPGTENQPGLATTNSPRFEAHFASASEGETSDRGGVDLAAEEGGSEWTQISSRREDYLELEPAVSAALNFRAMLEEALRGPLTVYDDLPSPPPRQAAHESDPATSSSRWHAETYGLPGHEPRGERDHLNAVKYKADSLTGTNGTDPADSVNRDAIRVPAGLGQGPEGVKKGEEEDTEDANTGGWETRGANTGTSVSTRVLDTGNVSTGGSGNGSDGVTWNDGGEKVANREPLYREASLSGEIGHEASAHSQTRGMGQRKAKHVSFSDGDPNEGSFDWLRGGPGKSGRESGNGGGAEDGAEWKGGTTKSGGASEIESEEEGFSFGTLARAENAGEMYGEEGNALRKPVSGRQREGSSGNEMSFEAAKADREPLSDFSFQPQDLRSLSSNFGDGGTRASEKPSLFGNNLSGSSRLTGTRASLFGDSDEEEDYGLPLFGGKLGASAGGKRLGLFDDGVQGLGSGRRGLGLFDSESAFGVDKKRSTGLFADDMEATGGLFPDDREQDPGPSSAGRNPSGGPESAEGSSPREPTVGTAGKDWLDKSEDPTKQTYSRRPGSLFAPTAGMSAALFGDEEDEELFGHSAPGRRLQGDAISKPTATRRASGVSALLESTYSSDEEDPWEHRLAQLKGGGIVGRSSRP